MPLWVQAVLVALFWLAFWPAVALWAYRSHQETKRTQVQDLYPPRVHASQLRPEPRR